MVTRQFSPRSRIYVDFCKPHGIWFDHLELQAAVRFVQRHPNAVMAWSARRTARSVQNAAPAAKSTPTIITMRGVNTGARPSAVRDLAKPARTPQA